ncbi:MAG: 50S ribosomal protein L15 [Pirellulales bacterium]|nr:50S ribosomal protein L15 [Pirellulales bacterium]
MNLNDIHRGVQTNRSRKRIGRGPGSGHGKTAGRGHKGQRSRSGYSSSPLFEGGQMPLFRRIPKRGFNNRFAPTVAVINVGDLEEHFQDGQQVDAESLKTALLVKGRYDLLKILGNGELTKKLTVAAHRFSAAAKEKIEKAGGQVQVLPGKKPVVKNKQKVKGKIEGQG